MTGNTSNVITNPTMSPTPADDTIAPDLARATNDIFSLYAAFGEDRS
ncbi:MAG: hypothetical protein ACJ70T_06120 [Nitrososphaera sp.]